MCNLYRLDPRDWSIKFVPDAQAFENLVNLMDSYEVYPDGEGLVIRAPLAETLRLVHAITAGLAGIGGAIQSSIRSLSRQMNRSFSDLGVKP